MQIIFTSALAFFGVSFACYSFLFLHLIVLKNLYISNFGKFKFDMIMFKSFVSVEIISRSGELQLNKFFIEGTSSHNFC